MIRRPPRSTHCISSAASDVYKRQVVQSSVHPPSWILFALGPTYWFADMFAELTVWFISRDPYLGVHRSVNMLGNQLRHETSLCEKRARTYMDDCPKTACDFATTTLSLPQLDSDKRHFAQRRRVLLQLADSRVATFYVTLPPRTSSGPLNAKKESVSYTHLTLPTICSV